MHRFIEPKPRLYNSRFTTAFLLELYVEVTPPPRRGTFNTLLPLSLCVYKESRACAYTTVQTATDTADGVLTLYKGAKTRASQRAAQTLNRKRKRRLKRFIRRRRSRSRKRQHRHTKKHTICTINTQKQADCLKTTQKLKNVYKN